MIPQIDNSIDDTNLVNEVILPSRTYRLSSNYETQIKYGETQNVVGESIMLTNAAEVKLKKLDIKGNTKQYTTTGKNLLKISGTSRTINGITFTQNNDGSINVKGTATADTTYTSTQLQTIQPNIRYKLSGCPNGGSTTTYRQILRVRSDETTNIVTISEMGDGSSGSFTTAANAKYILGEIIIYSGQTINKTFYPQLEEGSIATSYEPYTGGIASPNPQYPQDIQVVSGSNVINIDNANNKNLFNKNSNIVIPGYIDAAGNIITRDTTLFYQDKFIKVKPNTKYTISSNASTLYRIAEYSSNKEFLSRKYNGDASNSYTITTSSNTYYIKLAGTLITVLDSLQIEEGSTATIYEPYQGKEFPLDLPIENIFNYNAWLENKQNWETSRFSINKDYIISTMPTSNDWACLTPPMNATPSTADVERLTWMSFPVKPDTEYIMKLKNNNKCLMQVLWFFYNENYGYIQVGNTNGQANEYIVFKFTTTSATKFVSFRFDNESYSILPKQLIISEIQLQEVSKINDYVPYSYEPVELCKIGDYQDYFYKIGSKWYLHKEIGKTTFKGDEVWTYYVSNSVFYTDVLKTLSKANVNLLCNRFIKVANTTTYANMNTGEIKYDGIGSKRIIIKYTDLTSAADFKTWLSSNNVVVYYPLENSVDVEIINTTLISQLDNLQQAKLYQDTTYINSSNEVGPIIDVDYYPLSSIYYETTQVDRISGFIDDKNAIRQAVYHILSIERYSCLIYDDNYGVELQQYIGQDFEYLKVTIQKTLEEALMQDERIISIDVMNVEKIDNETANVKLSIQANVGEIQMEVNVNV